MPSFSRVIINRVTFFKGHVFFPGVVRGEESGGARCMKVTETTCDLVSKSEKNPPLEFNLRGEVLCGG